MKVGHANKLKVIRDWYLMKIEDKVKIIPGVFIFAIGAYITGLYDVPFPLLTEKFATYVGGFLIIAGVYLTTIPYAGVSGLITLPGLGTIGSGVLFISKHKPQTTSFDNFMFILFGLLFIPIGIVLIYALLNSIKTKDEIDDD